MPTSSSTERKAEAAQVKPKPVIWFLVKECPKGAWEMIVLLDNGKTLPLSDKDGIPQDQIITFLGDVQGYVRVFNEQCALTT